MFYSADFAHFQHFWLNGQSGITKGCEITNTTTNVTISKGYFIVHGRLLNVEAAEDIGSSYGFEEGYNRIVYEIDLSKDNTPTEFNQGAIKVLHTETLTQEDLDADGTLYQYPLCHFQWSSNGIASFVVDADDLDWENAFATLKANFDTYDKDFQTWLTAQKTSLETWLDEQEEDFAEFAATKESELQSAVNTANSIITELEADGFEKKAAYVSGTLLAASWNSSAKTYSFEATYPFASYDIEIQPSSTATTEQVEAFGGAMIVGSIDSNVATAKGDVPTVDIPIIIKVVAKYA